LVTGASSGIGATFARRLAAEGWNLVLVARREKRLDALASSLQAETEVIVADLAEQDDLARVMERSAADDLALLINCAGINGFGPADRVDPALLRRVIAINVTAPTLLVRATLPGMLARSQGSIVNVASRLAFASAVPPGGMMPRRGVYAASKGYLVTFTRTLESELAGTGVRVQALCPPLTATEFHLTDGASVVPDDAANEGGVGMTPEDVVTASLLALAAGETVCLPSLQDTSRIARYTAAEAAMSDAAAAPTTSSRR
jgi:short-subunit dehydrogenase